MRTGTADLPLHSGRAPSWLFERMVLLSREMALAIVANEGPRGVLRRMADPVWFQAFGCVLGFDWHSSGVTTTVCAALKEALRVVPDAGLVVAGGKGKVSRAAPAEIEEACMRIGIDAEPLIRASRLSAKVDSAAVQDGFQVYHHSFMFDTSGAWIVVQQGMNEDRLMARRYHWQQPIRFDCEPHAAVAGRPGDGVLNLVAREGEGNRELSALLAREAPGNAVEELARVRKLEMPLRHQVQLADIKPKNFERILLSAYEAQPKDFTDLLAVRGVGAMALRALSMVAELAYGEPASVRDPVTFSFAHGGKDGTPYPVDRTTYDATIESLRRAVQEAHLGRNDKIEALQRLAQLPAPAGPDATG